jgi:hypothetical protein
MVKPVLLTSGAFLKDAEAVNPKELGTNAFTQHYRVPESLWDIVDRHALLEL